MKMTLKRIIPVLFQAATILSIIIGVVALILAFFWNREMGVIITNLSISVEKTAKIVEGFPTRPVEPYPINIDDIVKEIFDYTETTDKVRKIEIYTDFVGYGMLTDNERWNNYWGEIKDIINKNNITVDWCFYDKEMRSIQIDNQFEYYSNKPDELCDFLERCKSKVKKPQDKNEIEQIQSMTNLTSLKTLLNDLLDKKEKNLEHLQTNNNTLTINRVKNILPLHAWFVYEENSDGKLIPVRGIMTYPTYEGGSTEIGYFSTNKDVLDVQSKALKALLKRQD